MIEQPWTCPECGGAWIRNYVFDHNPTACQLRDREDATQYADHERLQTRRQLDRDATETEIQLAEYISGGSVTPEAEFRNLADPIPTVRPVQTIVTLITGGIHHRVIGGIDPDQTN